MLGPADYAEKEPTTLWSQSAGTVRLKLEVVDCVAPAASIKEGNLLHFHGKSQRTGERFALLLKLYRPVRGETCQVASGKGKGQVMVEVQKVEHGRWPHLTSGSREPEYVKIDWDRWEELSGGGTDDDDSGSSIDSMIDDDVFLVPRSSSETHGQVSSIHAMAPMDRLLEMQLARARAASCKTEYEDDDDDAVDSDDEELQELHPGPGQPEREILRHAEVLEALAL